MKHMRHSGNLGFVACADGTFDVYCAGGLGANPKMGVLVDTGVAPRNVLYDVCAMVKTFQEHGNYENRARRAYALFAGNIRRRWPENCFS